MTIEDFIDPAFDPAASAESVALPNEFLDAAVVDPALIIDNLGIPPNQVSRWIARTASNNVLRLQQYLVYDIATQVGVLSPYVGATSTALQAFDVLIQQFKQEVIAAEMIQTSIGAVGKVLSAVPSIYTQIAGAIIQLGVSISQAITGGSMAPPRALLPCQEWSEETDATQFNRNVRAVTSTGYDWTSIFAPRYEGELSMFLCKHVDTSQLAYVWGMGDGQVPQLAVEGNSYQFEQDGRIIPAGGLGMIPGGERIYGLFQSTVVDMRDSVAAELASGGAIRYDGGHPTLFDPRCGTAASGPATADVASIDLGAYYPTSAQAAMSLWDFLFQRGAACYTVDTFDLAVGWTNYFEALWDGFAFLWNNPNYQGVGGKKGGLIGWGAGPWEGTLTDLMLNYGVGFQGQIGGLATWAPTGCQNLKDSDRSNFWTNSVLYKIMLPALSKLHYAQMWYLDNTTIAAYLPINGGVDADPLKGDFRMGAFRGNTIGTKNMRKKFSDARHRILNGSAKYDVRLDDVLDPVYRQQIEAKGGGTQGHALGLAALPAPADIAWTPTGGPGAPPKHTPPGFAGTDPHSLSIAASVITAAGVAWWFRDDIRNFVLGLRQRVRR